MSLMDELSKVDPEIAKEIDCELNRQRNPYGAQVRRG